MKGLVQENTPLAGLTTLGVGGSARYFVDATSEAEVLDGIDFARTGEIPLVILGGGSNLLVSDAGFPGLVLRVGIGGAATEAAGDRVLLRAGAGVDWDSLVCDSVARGLHGVECLSGIPGWVGGTPVQNVGAYGQEVADVIVLVRVFDLDTARVRELAAAECGFSYRTSLFNTAARGRYAVLAVEYALEKAGRSPLDHPDLARFFAGPNGDPSPSEVREAVRTIRAGKAMLLVEGDPDCRSAGSFFKNPVVDDVVCDAIEATARRLSLLGKGEILPRFPAETGRTKVPAAWLIERSGFARGFSMGPVGLSSRHALALVNRGGARAGDVLKLAAAIQQRVEERFGVRLSTEPAFLGFPAEVVERFSAVMA